MNLEFCNSLTLSRRAAASPSEPELACKKSLRSAPIIDQLDRSREILLRLASDIPEDKWSKVPSTGGWSPAKITAHLIMVENKLTSAAAQITQSPAIHLPRWKRLHLPIAIIQWRLIRVKTSFQSRKT
ncbi:MAG: DinB family protein [Candidatus Acidiferrales bacterium]